MDWSTLFFKEDHCVLRSRNQNWIASSSKVNCYLAEEVMWQDLEFGKIREQDKKKKRIKISLPERKILDVIFFSFMEEFPELSPRTRD